MGIWWGAAYDCGFNQSTQRVDGIVLPVYRNLVSFEGVHRGATCCQAGAALP